MGKSVSEMYKEFDKEKQEKKDKVFVTISLIFAVPYLLYKVAGFFGFEISPHFEAVQKSYIYQHEYSDFSETGMTQLFQDFYRRLAQDNWLQHADRRTNLTPKQIESCITLRFFEGQDEAANRVMRIEFACGFEEPKNDAAIVAAELKKSFEAYYKN